MDEIEIKSERELLIYLSGKYRDFRIKKISSGYIAKNNPYCYYHVYLSQLINTIDWHYKRYR